MNAPDHGVPADAEEELPLLLLASASPARQTLLESAGIAFTSTAADLDEVGILERADAALGHGESLDPAEQVLLLAREKAFAVTATSGGGFVVLGCDSLLQLGDDVVGKPGTAAAARERWQALRGRTGVLHTGHWIVDDRDPEDGGTGATLGETVSTEVAFAALSDEEIEAYVATGEPLHVAGGFTIDGLGGPFIESITGDHHAVIGLSLPLLRRLLAEIGLGIHELWR